ncbi:MAG: succinyl-diaminopimelate desuccinylase [Alphaproteobacteria bacterium]
MDIAPLALASDLIRCPSVTPRDEGALQVVQAALEALGFTCHRLTFAEAGTAEVDNLYARIGTEPPNLCFAGHTDVVPPGSRDGWTVDPFSAEVRGDTLYGRGATDMKGAIACFIAAAGRYLGERGDGPVGSISLLITGDEEGPAINGTARVLRWLAERGETLDACLVGEPTCVSRLGDTVKVGRRGSLSGHLTVHGAQGHTAYPHLASNPIPRLIAMLAAITAEPLDGGSERFDPSSVEITTIDVANPATNVIPAAARASFNIRFNDLHSAEGLGEWLRRTFDEAAGEGGRYDLDIQVSGEAFLSPPGPFAELVAAAVESALGLRPELGTSGGTSDGRFLHRHCPVAEFGLPGRTMHKVDECVALADLEALTGVYKEVLDRFLAAAGGGGRI